MKPKLEKDEYGFRKGSDVSVVLEELIAGGESKHDVAKRIQKRFEGQTTKNGKPKAVSTIMNQVVQAMVRRGFSVEAGWKLVPPPDGKILPRYHRRPTLQPAEKLADAEIDTIAQVAQAHGIQGPQKVNQTPYYNETPIPTSAKVPKPRSKPKPRARRR